MRACLLLLVALCALAGVQVRPDERPRVQGVRPCAAPFLTLSCRPRCSQGRALNQVDALTPAPAPAPAEAE